MNEKLNYPRRPPRLTRVFEGLSHFYFITFNTHNRRPMLANPELHAVFSAFCLKAQEFNVAVGQYVIMPDHIHVFVKMPPTGHTLAQWVQALRAVLGKELVRQGQPKPHWQEGFFDHLLRSGESYAEKWDYARQNPVRKGLATTPEAWPYQGAIMEIRW